MNTLGSAPSSSADGLTGGQRSLYFWCMAANKEEQEMWVDWTHDGAGLEVDLAKSEDVDEIIDDAVDIAVAYADAMLAEYKSRFSSGPTRSRSKRRKKKPELDPDDDDDDN